MRFVFSILFGLCGLPAVAQEVSSNISGVYGNLTENGIAYQAEVYRSSEYLVVRVWEGPMGDPTGLTLVLDNTKFDLTPYNGREWLEQTDQGDIALMIEAENDGYLYTTRTVLTHIDNMIAVTGHARFNNQLGEGPIPEMSAQCFSDACWSCEADLLNGSAIAGGASIVANVAYEDLNAALWQADRAIDLGLCPAYE